MNLQKNAKSDSQKDKADLQSTNTNPVIVA